MPLTEDAQLPAGKESDDAAEHVALFVHWLEGTNLTLSRAKEDLELVHRQAAELYPTFSTLASGEPDSMGDLVGALALFAGTTATALETTRTIIGKQIAAFDGSSPGAGEVH